MTTINTLGAPFFYVPRSYQQKAWERRNELDEHGNRKYKIYIKVWSRQAGKDSDDLIYELMQGYTSPNTHGAYVGLNNKWIENTLFRKIIDSHPILDNFPHSSHGNIPGTNSPQPDSFSDNKTKMRIDWWDINERVLKENGGFTLFIGFIDNQKLLGTSYERYTFSEYSVYDSDPMEFMEQILDMHPETTLNINSTPRGMNNQLYKLIEAYAPESIVSPGVIKGGEYMSPAGNVFIDIQTIWDVAPDIAAYQGISLEKFHEKINAIKERYRRKYGNDSMFEQEFECKFLTMSAGTVYLGIQTLIADGRLIPTNVNKAYPVLCALDIASKDTSGGDGKDKDSSAIIFFQNYNGHYYILDCYEERGMPITQFVRESISKFGSDVQYGILPWDGGVGVEKTPQEFLQEEFPTIHWEVLKKGNGSVHTGIQMAREWLPNLIVNSNKCQRFMEAAERYHYEWSDRLQDYSQKPYHDWSSHMMDAFRYAAQGLQVLLDSGELAISGNKVKKEWGTYVSLTLGNADDENTSIYGF